MSNQPIDRFEPMSRDDWATLDMSEREKAIYYASKQHQCREDEIEEAIHQNALADRRKE